MTDRTPIVVFGGSLGPASSFSSLTSSWILLGKRSIWRLAIGARMAPPFRQRFALTNLSKGRTSVLFLARSIAERKRAEDEMGANEERFRSFVDHATDGFFLFDQHRHSRCQPAGV
jgi:PAS domain-containing protein